MKEGAPKQKSIITVRVPMTFTVRGGRKMIISEVTQISPQPRIDNALLKALARAFRWRRLIEGGKYASITELAKAEGVNQSYACRLLRLTLLAPAIVAEILNGRQASGLMLKGLLGPLPSNWNEQIKFFKDPRIEQRPGAGGVGHQALSASELENSEACCAIINSGHDQAETL
jgi:hypothetical protein